MLLANKIRGFPTWHEPVSVLEMNFEYTRVFLVVSTKTLEKEYPSKKHLGLHVKIYLLPELLPGSDDAWEVS